MKCETAGEGGVTGAAEAVGNFQVEGEETAEGVVGVE